MSTQTHKPLAATRPPGKSRPLTLKQQRFVNALPTAKSATQAAIIAGYSTSSPDVAKSAGCEVLTSPYVQAAIEAQNAAIQRKSIADAVERKETLTEILRDKLPGPYPVAAVIDASDQLNRMENLYVTRSQSVNLDVDVELEGFTLDELRLMLSAANDAKGARLALKGKGDGAK